MPRHVFTCSSHTERDRQEALQAAFQAYETHLPHGTYQRAVVAFTEALHKHGFVISDRPDYFDNRLGVATERGRD